jgi:DeoR/GlpR family transcriptional regulator of sugar metabolism
MAYTKAERRHKEILHLLSSVPIASVAELSQALEVSIETIRKDLEYLSTAGQVLKVHGGVALVDSQETRSPYNLRSVLNTDKKYRIAKAAATLIEAGDSLILESSTTTVELFRVLLQDAELLKTLVIITNSFKIVSLCEEAGSCCQRLFFLGGWANTGEHCTRGQFTTSSLGHFHVNKAFLSGAALNDDFMLTGYYDDDVAFQKQALAVAKTAVLLIDNSKFGKSAIQVVQSLSAFQYMVTDTEFSTEIIRDIENRGTRILGA